MHINDSTKIRRESKLYDILGRLYIVKNYYIKFFDGKLDGVYLDLENEFGNRFTNISYEYLYFSVEEFSDPELEFISYVKGEWFDTDNIYTMDLNSLNKMRKCFVHGFYSGIKHNENRM